MIKWLLAGDPSIQYQVNRDLLNGENESLQKTISQKGWGAKYLSLQNQNGHWGFGFYQPKWISTHYTLLDLKNLCISPKTKKIQNIIEKVLNNEMLRENDSKHNIVSEDICINGMVLNYASYFKSNENNLKSIVDYLLDNQMNDGGFNCHSTRIGAVHSSLHTTLSVLEGLFEFRIKNYTYKIQQIRKVEYEAIEFILKHKLYKSDKTGKIIKPSFTRMPYPPRWKYDILRCLDFFQYAKVPYDSRMNDALELILSKRDSNGVWKLQAKHPGKVHFEMEKPGQPSRWNTLRALRVLKHFRVL
ncbi:MAG: hypothetical protein H6613_09245 [Ignavibacteriales bacterium]|nr:hypothetical protein [Ignavibacteriales bacterium]